MPQQSRQSPDLFAYNPTPRIPRIPSIKRKEQNRIRIIKRTEDTIKKTNQSRNR